MRGPPACLSVGISVETARSVFCRGHLLVALEENRVCLRSFFQAGDTVNVTMIEMLRVHPEASSLKSLEDCAAYVEGV